MTANEVSDGIDTQWMVAVIKSYEAAILARRIDADPKDVLAAATMTALEELEGRNDAETSAAWIGARTTYLTRHGI